MGFISEIIGYPLGWIMWLIYSIFKNYGVAIMFFTFIVRLILFPLSVKQQKSTAAMAAFQPKLDKLKKQYGNNQQKLQEEQMKLYNEENINPMASCLPMVFQLLFLYGVFDVVYRPLTHILRISKEGVEALKAVAAPLFETNNYFNARPELYILQAIKDDPSIFEGQAGVTAEMLTSIEGFSNKLFGLIDLGSIPKSVFTEGTVWNAAAVGLLLIPIVSGLIQLAMTIYTTQKQKKLNPAAAAQTSSMNMMFYIMPLFSVYIAFSYPAGIGFYWICSSVVGLIQSIVLNKVFTPEYVAKLVEKDKIRNKNKKRSGFMQKYTEMMQQQGTQSSGNSDRAIAASGIVKDEETGEEIKISKSQMKDYERKIIAEARKKQAELYGDGTVSNDEDDD